MQNTPTIQKKIIALLISEGEDLCLLHFQRKLKGSKSWIHKNLLNLVADGRLQTYGSNPKFYSITQAGKSIGQGVGISKRSHGIQLTIPIIQKPIDWACGRPEFIKISNEIHMRGWKEEIRARWRGNFMMITPSSITIHLTEFWDNDVRINLLNALHKGKQFCRDMEEINPGLKLGKINKGSLIFLSAQEHAIGLPKNPNIKSFKGKTFLIDWSKGYPELEFKDNKNSADQMDRFSTFIDSIADGEITLEDIQAIRELKRANKTKQIVQQAIRYAKILWMQRDHKPPYTSTTQVPGYPTAEQRKKWDAFLPKILRRTGPDVYNLQNQTKKTGD